MTNDESAVCLVLGPSLLPVGRDVEMQMAAYHTTLAPGGQLQHTLRFPLPLCEWYAYWLPTPVEGQEPVLVYQVHVFVEVVLQSRVMSAGPAPGHADLFHLTPKGTELIRQTITPDDRVPVLRSKDRQFPRL